MKIMDDKKQLVVYDVQVVSNKEDVKELAVGAPLIPEVSTNEKAFGGGEQYNVIIISSDENSICPKTPLDQSFGGAKSRTRKNKGSPTSQNKRRAMDESRKTRSGTGKKCQKKKGEVSARTEGRCKGKGKEKEKADGENTMNDSIPPAEMGASAKTEEEKVQEKSRHEDILEKMRTGRMRHERRIVHLDIPSKSAERDTGTH